MPTPAIEIEFEAALAAALHNVDHQIRFTADGTVYVATGDIPAEWLRDSSAQLRPYLFFLADPVKADLVKRAIQRQVKSLSIDPYANAFREDYSVWERKFELDSLAYPILFAWTYWKMTADASVFTPELKAGFRAAVNVMRVEQDHDGRRYPYVKSPYSFRSDTQASTLRPVNDTGLIWTGFRPSDDPCVYGYLIPAEMMAVQALGALSEMAAAYREPALAAAASAMREEVRAGIQADGVITVGGTPTYAYEVDGFGHSIAMDDANMPSLLSAPYFGFPRLDDVVYQNTRAWILSAANPYFYVGKYAAGVGSPHTPAGYVWPLALLADALTLGEGARSDDRRARLLRMLLASEDGQHRLHESFDPNDVSLFTRPDFGWPNSLFAEFALTEVKGVPRLPTPPPPPRPTAAARTRRGRPWRG